MTPQDFHRLASEIGVPGAYALAFGDPKAEDKMVEMIPAHCREGLACWILFARPVGHFLTATLEGDLFGALRRADDVNRDALPGYAMFLHCYAPGGCFGSKARVAEWTGLYPVERAA